MAIIKFINNQVGLKKSLNYICKEEKTEHKLVTGKDCMIESAYEEMMAVKNMYNKNKGREKIHFVQAFSPNDKIDYETAHEIAIKLTEKYKGFKDFQIVMATHEDKKHIHTHFIINTVNFNNGKKIQFSKNDLKKIKQISNELCKEYGLSITNEKSNIDDIKINEYKARLKGISWKVALEKDIDKAMSNSNNKYQFFKCMNKLGYKVTWTKDIKNITYTTPMGFKCRDKKLHNEKYLKDNMEAYFKEKFIKNVKLSKTKKVKFKSISSNLAEIIEQFKANSKIESSENISGYSENAKKQFAIEMHYSTEELDEMEF